MKLLIVSDSHGNVSRIQKIVDQEDPFDCLIHCGDGIRDLFHVDVPGGARIVRVSGNIDLSVVYDMDRIVTQEIGGMRFMITHGDLYDAHNGYGMLLSEGRKMGCDIVLFGHTHTQYHSGGRPILFNPGAAANGFYGVINIAEGKDAEFLHRRIG